MSRERVRRKRMSSTGAQLAPSFQVVASNELDEGADVETPLAKV